MDIATLRILRLTIGTSVSLWFSQAVAWDISFKFIILDPKTGFAEEIWKVERSAYGVGFRAHVDTAYLKRRQD